MSSQIRGRALIFRNRKQQEKQYQNFSQTVYNFWHVEHCLLSPVFWVFTLTFPASSEALFLSASQICEKGISSQIEPCSLSFHMFIPGHTVKLLSRFYVGISLTCNELSFTESEARKLMPGAGGGEERRRRRARSQAGLRPGHQAAHGPNSFSS